MSIEDDWIMGALAAQNAYKPIDDTPLIPPEITVPPNTKMVLGSDPNPREWGYKEGTFGEIKPHEGSPSERLGYDVGRDLESIGVRSKTAHKIGDVAKGALGMMPGVGSGISWDEAKEAFKKGNYGEAALDTAMAVPIVGAAKGPIKAALKDELKAAKNIMGDVVATPGIGHNNPPSPIETPVVQLPPDWNKGLPKPKPAARSTEIPDIRGLPVDEAVAIARKQPHLIKSGEQAEGLYVGGPRDLISKVMLNKRRKDFDDYIAADPRGGDWYDRYRTGVTSVTGGDPVHNRWMANQEGQWSAGVDPGSELHFALKENNASIAGMPVKASMPAQHQAHLAAIAAKDPARYQLGEKTGEYAGKVNPDVVNTRPPGATGVNDFRHARNFGYTEVTGEPQRGALGSAGHRFLDMETALAVDRANRSNLGGRSNWTGEQLQAAPWVRQKALDIQERGGRNADGSFKLSYEEAFERANKTITDFFPRHTAYATFESQPGSVTGHLPGSVSADQASRVAYAQDPRSTWATAPGGRDAVYSGLGVEGTGNFMRVRPSQPMQGWYKPPDGPLEINPGEVARPLVTFDTPTTYKKDFVGPRQPEPFKTLTAHDRAILEAGEAFRGWTDAQNASAAHKNWFGGPANQTNSLFFQQSGKGDVAEMTALQSKAAPLGLGDIVDTGSGQTVTSFYPGTTPEIGKAVGKAVKKGEFGEFGEPVRARTEGIYIDYTDKWVDASGAPAIGSKQATEHMLSYVTKTPELRAAFNNNPHIAERALAKLERDEEWAEKWGTPRQDIQNARRIVADGPGWVDRLEAALKDGSIALPAVAAVFAAGSLAMRQGRDQGESYEGL